MKVHRVDDMGKTDIIAYGIVNLPNITESFELKVLMWRPIRGWLEDSYNFYLGDPPKLKNSDPVVKYPKQRHYLTTMSSGTIHVQCDSTFYEEIPSQFHIPVYSP